MNCFIFGQAFLHGTPKALILEEQISRKMKNRDLCAKVLVYNRKLIHMWNLIRIRLVHFWSKIGPLGNETICETRRGFKKGITAKSVLKDIRLTGQFFWVIHLSGQLENLDRLKVLVM